MLKKLLEEIMREYETGNRGIKLIVLNEEYQFVTKS